MIRPYRSDPIDACAHRWGPLAERRRECLGDCGVVLQGHIAEAPPERGMDWSRAALVAPDLVQAEPNTRPSTEAER